MNVTPTLRLAGIISAAVVLLATTPAHAVLMADGITYTLTEFTTANPLVDQFDLHISGINAGTDTEGGRSGVNAIAFTEDGINYSTASMISPPSGFVLHSGGLASGGCDDSSTNFFCFDNTGIPPTPSTAFATNSTLDFVFNVTLSSGNFSAFDPHLKIDWVGSKNNYDLVSQELPITPGGQCTTGCTTGGGGQEVPEPGTLVLLGSALVGLGAMRRRWKSSAART